MKIGPATGALMAMALMAASTTAWSKTVTVTLSGSTETINDASGVFGPAGERITDQPFTQVFVIDTDVGTFSPPTPTSASYDSIFGAPGPFAVSGSLTINGHTFSTPGDNYSSAFITPGVGVTPTVYQLLSDGFVPGVSADLVNQIFSLELDGSNLPLALTQSLELYGTGDASQTPFRLVTSNGDVSVYDSFIDGVNDASGNAIVDAQGSLYPTTLTIAEVSAAPEASTWALMVFGVAAAGASLRRRKPKPVFEANPGLI